MSLAAIQRETELPRWLILNIINEFGRYLGMNRVRTNFRTKATYDASIIEYVKAIAGLPYQEPSHDWLAEYLQKGNDHALGAQEPQRARNTKSGKRDRPTGL